jgi:hypothetical protein
VFFLFGLIFIMSDLRQALQHGAPSEASKNKTVRNKKTLNNCFRKSLSKQVKSGSSKRVLRGFESQVASKASLNDLSELQYSNNESDETSTRYMLASNSILNTSSAISTVLTSNDSDQIKTNVNSRIASIQSGFEIPQIVDSTQKMRIRLRQLEQSKDFQLRANVGVCSVANNSLIDMGIDKKRNVSKNIFSKNNLPIQMERNEVNDQLVAFSKANEILSHQLRELREYVGTIESSLPSKTAQNLNDISIVAKSMIDERDNKTGEKEIDRMLKVMPYFNGDSGDNFEAWVLSAKKIISYGKNCTEEQKLDVVLTKVRGNALETLEFCGNLNSVDLVFSNLKKTYGKDQRALISNLKQLSNESVKLFSVRLKNNLRALGIVEVASNPSVIALDYFISGLLPTISKRVKQLLPETYSAAEGYAFQIECENLSSQAKKNEFLNSF